MCGNSASDNVGLAGVVAGGCGEGGLGCRYIARQGRHTLLGRIKLFRAFSMSL